MPEHPSLSFVWIGLGANLGDDPAAALRRALDQLDALSGVSVNAHSPFFRSAPLGPPQPWYVNAAARLVVSLAPLELLDCLLELEARAGRDRSREIRWGPRPLDLDLLMWGSRILDHPRLTLPHPRMRLRRFVLAPLATLDPGLIHPLCGATIDSLLRTVEDASHVELMEPTTTPFFK